ncbi:MAG: hypothetical protein SGILL_005202 [Bacillariaceae sp.]
MKTNNILSAAVYGRLVASAPLCFLLCLSSGLTFAAGWGTWTKADRPPGVTSPTFSPPPAVSGHVATSSPRIPNVYLFGGLTGPAGSPTTDTLYEYDVGGWREITQKKGPMEESPRQRMYSAAGILEEDMYLFGGWDPGAPGSGGEFLNDVWKLDLVTKEWENTGIELPFPVSRHAACAVGDMIVIHTYQGVFVFRKDGDSRKITLQDTSGDRPDGLSMCAQVTLGDSGVLIFGGSTKTQQLSDATYYLDTNTWEWTQLRNIGDATPSSRASPCAAAVQDSSTQAVVFGGASIGGDGYEGGKGLMPLSDTWLVTVNKAAGTALWKQLAMSDVGPEARLAASLSCIYGEGGNRLILQGGYDSTSKETFGEPWVLRIDE